MTNHNHNHNDSDEKEMNAEPRFEIKAEIKAKLDRAMGKTEDDPTARAWTKEELQRRFVEAVLEIAKEWDSYELEQGRSRSEGVAFSILALLDGSNITMPAFDLIPAPHSDEKEYAKETGTNWHEPVCFNDDVHLHELFHRVKAEKEM